MKYEVALALFLLQNLSSGCDTEHLMTVETLIYLICKVRLNVNYFTVDKGKGLICKVFTEAEMILSACMQNSA